MKFDHNLLKWEEHGVQFDIFLFTPVCWDQTTDAAG